MTEKPKLWKKYGDIMLESIEYLSKRKTREIKPLKTAWNQFNNIGLNGIEWNSLTIISSRPGVGKTLISSSLARGIQQLNTDQDFNVLHFQFEMLGRNMCNRELSAENNMNIRYIQSAEDDGMPVLSDDDFNKLHDYALKQGDRNEYIIDKPLTVDQIKSTIIEFYREFKKPFIVTLDHTLLIKKGPMESTKQVTLENLSTTLVELKNAYPICFFILSQMNRSIDDAERQSPGKLSNFPSDDDIYGSDHLMQCADIVLAYNRPAKYNLAIYGPQKFIIRPEDKYLLACHKLKNRFGSVGIDWYRADYPTMSIVEIEEPMTQSKFKS